MSLEIGSLNNEVVTAETEPVRKHFGMLKIGGFDFPIFESDERAGDQLDWFPRFPFDSDIIKSYSPYCEGCEGYWRKLHTDKEAFCVDVVKSSHFWVNADQFTEVSNQIINAAVQNIPQDVILTPEFETPVTVLHKGFSMRLQNENGMRTGHENGLVYPPNSDKLLVVSKAILGIQIFRMKDGWIKLFPMFEDQFSEEYKPNARGFVIATRDSTLAVDEFPIEHFKY